MSKGRRALILAVAGLFISTGSAQEPESRPLSREAMIALIEQSEKDVQDPAKLEAVWARIYHWTFRSDALNEEWKARAHRLVSTTRLGRLKMGLDVAKAKAASGSLTDAIRACDEAEAKFHAEFDRLGTPSPSEVETTIDRYKELLALSDSLSERLETAEYERSVDERDLLAAKERAPGPWGASAGAKFAWSERKLTIEGIPVEGGRRFTGVVSVLPSRKEPWRDLILDLEFTILSGDFELFLRYWPDKRSYRITFNAASGYEPNKPYHVTIRVKGSSVTMQQPGQPENRGKMDATTSRTGGFGFGLNPGSKVTIARAGMKVLRPTDSRALALERLREIVGPPRPVVRPAPLGTESRPSLQRVEAESLLESARLEALRTYDAAVTTLQHELRAGGGAPDAGALRILVEAIAESDALVAKVETPEFEARIGERDMLSAKERTSWGASAGAKHTWPGRELSIEGVPIEKGKVTGVVSMLPTTAAPWHDIVLDLEFTILSGDFEMYVRYWPDRKAYKIRFGPSDGYELNKPYRMTIRVKGSDVSLAQPDQPENRDRFQPSTSRTGGIGFGLTPGSKAEISKLGLKVLR